MASASTVTVRDNPAANRYELLVDGKVKGSLYYSAEPGKVTLIHTEVDPSLKGRGLGSRLVHDALERIRADEVRLVPVCPFVRSYLKRHPEYMDLSN